jgi:hypothetical protein
MGRVTGAHRLAVLLLAACFGWVLPAHHHAPGHAGHAERVEIAGYEPGHDDGGGCHDDQDHHPPAPAPHEGHAGDCPICHAARTLYTPVAVALPVMAPAPVTSPRPVDADQVVSVRPEPVYHGRAPPLAA